MKYFIIAGISLFFALFSTFGWTDPAPRTIEISAKKFEYTPSEIHIKKGESVVLKFTTTDRKHGFKVPELGLTAVIKPGEPTLVPFTATKTGRFEFHCSIFCGSGHESMTGAIIVE